MFYCYILRSLVSGSYYVGCTNDIENRLGLHNNGQVKSTKGKKPWQLIHIEKFDILTLARKRESQIKKWKSRAAIERLITTVQIEKNRGSSISTSLKSGEFDHYEAVPKNIEQLIVEGKRK